METLLKDPRHWDSDSGIKSGEIQLHLLGVGGGSLPVEDFLALLPPGERDQFRRFKSEGKREEFFLSRLFLRHLLASTLGRGIGMMRFSQEPHGKPYLSGSWLHFNLSHTRGFIACALGRSPLGVDVESIPEVPEAQRRAGQVALRYFSGPELGYLESLPASEWTSAFARIFTLKEAHAKALGKGLSLPGKSFTVPLPPGESSQLGVMEYLSLIRATEAICLAYVGGNPGGGPMRYHLWEWDIRILSAALRDRWFADGNGFSSSLTSASGAI